MSSSTSPTPRLAEWIAARTPPVPDAFRSAVVPEEAEAPASSEALLNEARAAVDRALSHEPRDRPGAFDLLAADAFATWAAEAALTEDDPEAALLGLVRRLQRRGGESE